MNPVDAEAIERLLALPPAPDLLERWLHEVGARLFPEDAPPVSPSRRTHAALVAHARVDPARTLRAVQHIARSRVRHSAEEAALFARLEGLSLLAVGRAPESAVRYEDSASRFRAMGNAAEEARTLIGWTFALAIAGRPKDALRVARRGRGLLAPNDTVPRARLETNLGTAWQLAGRFDLAIERYEFALRGFARAGAVSEAALTAHNLGLLWMMLDDTPKARRYLERARGSFAATGSHVPALYSETILTTLDLAEGHWEKGLGAITSLRERFRAIGDQRAEAWLHRELALLFASLGAIEAALPEARAAHALFQQLGLWTDAAHAALHSGRLLALHGAHQDAFALLEEAAHHWRSIGHAWSLHRTEIEIARVLVATGQAERALAILKRARSYLDRRDPGGDGALCGAVIASAYLELGRHRHAERTAMKAYSRALRYPARLERPAMALLIARAHSASGNRDLSRRWACRAVRLVEAQLLRFGSRQIRILTGDSRDRVYSGATDIVLDSGGARSVRLAVDLVSRGRVPNLIEDLEQNQKGHMRPATRAAIVRLRDELLAGQKTEAAEPERAHELQRQLARLEQKLAPARRPPSLVRRALRERAFVRWRKMAGAKDVVLYDNGREWRALIARAGGPLSYVALPHAADALARAWTALRLTVEAAARLPQPRRREFLERTLSASRRQIEQLREAFWSPLELRSDRVVLIPNQDLHGVPLEALADPSVEVSRLPHPALLRTHPADTGRRALVLHGSARDSEAEAQNIAAVLRTSGFEVEIGDRRAALSRSAHRLRILHVAAHGQFRRRGWLLSGLQLADGWLGFEQLQRPELAGALLHFSSCESGLAERTPGSDTSGWIHAGLGAGAHELVLNVWRVDGASTSRFSEAFYREIGKGTSAAAAARDARAAVRTAEPHPFSWASFVVVA